MSKRTRTPCVGICSTTYGDDVCRGCKRFVTEVINWNSFDSEEREAVWKRLEKLKTQIMKARVIVVDEEKLLEKIKEYRLKIHEDLNNYCKVFELIKQASKSFSNLEEFGVKTKRDSINLELLKDETEKELYELSLAHHSRYFIEPAKYKEIDIN